MSTKELANEEQEIPQQQKMNWDVPDEFVNELSNFINENGIKLIDKKLDIYDIINTFLEKNQSEDPFFIVNIGDIIRQYKKWEYYLPNIKPFYAVKSCPDKVVLDILSRLGTNFDCASKNEIVKIIDMKISPDRIIFANPCKMSNQIKFACAHDVDLLVVDSETELYKIKLYHPDSKLVFRIKTDDKHSICKFSCKFGADLEEAENILKIARNLKLNMVGVSFHVGSGCMSTETYEIAIRDSKIVFDLGKKIGYNFYLLDIGGGFLSVDTDKLTFKDVAETINNSIGKYFGGYNDKLQVIAEPGRFFVEMLSHWFFPL